MLLLLLPPRLRPSPLHVLPTDLLACLLACAALHCLPNQPPTQSPNPYCHVLNALVLRLVLQIWEYWGYCGEIEALDMMTFPDTGRFRGIAFITFCTVGGRYSGRGGGLEWG